MLVVVGGHSRNIGKTSVAASIIRGIPEACWTAVKITQHGHGICAEAGKTCDCAIRDCRHPYALTRETDEDGRGDTSRFLAAGAKQSWWLRTAMGELSHAVPALRQLLDSNENVILESNSVMEFFEPDLYLVVFDAAVEDFKKSSRRYLDRADALVLTGKASSVLPAKPRFEAPPPGYTSPGLLDFIRRAWVLARA